MNKGQICYKRRRFERVGYHIFYRERTTTTTTTTVAAADMNGMRMMVSEPVKEKYALNIGTNKWVSVDVENDVFIRDSENGKRAFFTPSRWVQFVEDIPCIDKAVQRAMTLKPTDFRIHIGGNWHVSVNDEVPTVDFRRWFTRTTDSTLRLSPAGIALSYAQWESLKNVVEQMKADFEDVEPCWHNSQVDHMNCRECTPRPLFNDSPVSHTVFNDSPASPDADAGPTAPTAAAADAVADDNVA